jgi:ABC-type glycerol-3-phosphate transport system permease component
VIAFGEIHTVNGRTPDGRSTPHVLDGCGDDGQGGRRAGHANLLGVSGPAERGEQGQAERGKQRGHGYGPRALPATYTQASLLYSVLQIVFFLAAVIVVGTVYRYPAFALVCPPIIMLVPLFLLARELGLTNSLLGLALTCISFALPYALWILRAFFQSIPVELEQAALIDGANRAQALTYVVMPLALPGIIATAIFTFIVAWNDFLFALVLIGKDDLKTLAIGINEFFHMAVVDWGLIMAAGVMVTIPALAFFIAIQRYLIAGWGAGGLKG